MAKPKNVIPTVEKKLQIASDLCVRMELELFSDLEGKIPYGEQSKLVNQLLRKHFEKLDNERANKPMAIVPTPVPAEQ